MTYQLFNDEFFGSFILKTEDNGKKYTIPMNESNKDYQEYLEWVAEGNTPLPADS